MIELEAIPDDHGSLLELAVLLARQAGHAAVEMRSRVVGSATTKSSPTDPVTAADEAAEEIIVGGIRTARPDDGIIGEEGAEHVGSSDLQWIIDPIDGTNNFVHGLPQFAVSVAVARATHTVVGVVYSPVSDELYTATLGGGAFRNGQPISVSTQSELATALVATGFSYNADRRRVQATMLTTILPRIADIRRLGSAALDLCTVAAGSVDAYYEEGLNTWDYAAGKLIVEEAGGYCDTATELIPGAELVLAGPTGLVEELRLLLHMSQQQP